MNKILQKISDVFAKASPESFVWTMKWGITLTILVLLSPIILKIITDSPMEDLIKYMENILSYIAFGYICVMIDRRRNKKEDND